MNESVISYKTHKLAQELGFNIEICRCGGYPECICIDLPPTQSLLQKWIREKFNTQVYVVSRTIDGKGKYRDYVVYVDGMALNDARDEEYQSYEEALEFGLQQKLKSLKK